MVTLCELISWVDVTCAAISFGDSCIQYRSSLDVFAVLNGRLSVNWSVHCVSS